MPVYCRLSRCRIGQVEQDVEEGCFPSSAIDHDTQTRPDQTRAQVSESYTNHNEQSCFASRARFVLFPSHSTHVSHSLSDPLCPSTANISPSNIFMDTPSSALLSSRVPFLFTTYVLPTFLMSTTQREPAGSGSIVSLSFPPPESANDKRPSLSVTRACDMAIYIYTHIMSSFFPLPALVLVALVLHSLTHPSIHPSPASFMVPSYLILGAGWRRHSFPSCLDHFPELHFLLLGFDRNVNEA